MTVSDVMTSEVITVTGATPLADARALMRKNGIHHLVVKRGAHPVGVVSARDIGRAPRSSRATPRIVSDVMSRHVFAVQEQTTVDRAAHVMRGRSLGCLVVLRRGEVVGIVTAADLLTILAGRSRRGRRADTSTAIHHRVGHHHRSRGDGVW